MRARPFTNFVLRGEFLQEQEIADSGVFLRFPDPGNDPWVAVKKGHEMEIGDPNPEKPTWRTGAIYPFHAPVAAKHQTARPMEQLRNRLPRPRLLRAHQWQAREHLDRHDQADLSGFIGLQNYNDGKTVRHPESAGEGIVVMSRKPIQEGERDRRC